MSTLTYTKVGLTTGEIYSFRIQAHNAVELDGPSSESLAVIAAKRPDAPAAPTAVGSETSVTMSWVAPYDGGSPITSYLI